MFCLILLEWIDTFRLFVNAMPRYAYIRHLCLRRLTIIVFDHATARTNKTGWRQMTTTEARTLINKDEIAVNGRVHFKRLCLPSMVDAMH